MPTPLEIIPTPLFSFSDWDYDKKQKLAMDDIRFNLVGHELAAILIEINLLASAGNLADENRNQLITEILRNHSTISSLNFEAIGNEISMQCIPVWQVENHGIRIRCRLMIPCSCK